MHFCMVLMAFLNLAAVGPTASTGAALPVGGGEYSLTRALIVDNPGVLLFGDTFLDLTTDLALQQRGDFHYPGGFDPAQTKQVVIENDSRFGDVIKCYHTDAETFLPGGTIAPRAAIEGGDSWSPGVDEVWMRVLMRFDPGFVCDQQGSAAKAWKCIFGSGHRHVVFFNCTGFRSNYEQHGGSFTPLPGSDYTGGAGWGVTSTAMWASDEWWEFIIFEQNISTTHKRTRIWMRQLTTGAPNRTIISLPQDETSWFFKFGVESTGATVPVNELDSITYGRNRNAPLPVGPPQFYLWGPLECLDAAVVFDPYGIEDQIK